MSGMMIVHVDLRPSLQSSVISHILESTQCFENFRFWDRSLHCLKASSALSNICS